MVDEFESPFGDELAGSGIGHVPLDELGSRGDVAQTAGRKIVQDAHPVAKCQMRLRDVAADKPRTSGNKNPSACAGNHSLYSSRDRVGPSSVPSGHFARVFLHVRLTAKYGN